MSGAVTGRPVVNPQIGYRGIYQRLQPPPYVYQEFPKEVRLANGQSRIVQSLKDELDLRATEELASSAPARHPVESERDELQAKLTIAQQKEQQHEARMQKMQEQIDKLLAAVNATAGAEVKMQDTSGALRPEEVQRDLAEPAQVKETEQDQASIQGAQRDPKDLSLDHLGVR